jgi:GntR family transcriptional regulator
MALQSAQVEGEILLTSAWASLQDRIYHYLLTGIIDGKYAAGDAIPTEAKLEKLFNVSKAPVRHALVRLQTEGLILRQRGMGSFVKKQPPDNAWTKASGFASYFRTEWDHISIEILEVSVSLPAAHIAAFFGTPDDEPLTRTLRLRRHEKLPVMLLESWYLTKIPVSDFSDPQKADVLFNFLKEYGVILDSAEEMLEPIALKKEQAAFLEVSSGIPALHIERRALDRAKRPVSFSECWVPSGTWKYHSSIIT